jgi:hypothetical protein
MPLLCSKASTLVGYIFLLLLLLTAAVHGNTCASNLEKKKDLLVEKARWAIVALARPYKDDAVLRNQLIAEKLRPYASKHNITVIIFSEEKFPNKLLAEWKAVYRGVATVRLIDTSSRGFSTGPERFGYKYMCKFFSFDIYDYLRDDYDYYMRVDTDCYLISVNYDILQWVQDNNVGYGFGMRKIESHRATTATLPDWAATYTKKCHITPSAVMELPFSTPVNFYNNWHIGRVGFFNRPDVRHFLATVNASGHILSHRWGDSTIQAYAVRIFMNPAELMQVPNFTYIHGSHDNKVVSTFLHDGVMDVPQGLPMWKYGGA